MLEDVAGNAVVPVGDAVALREAIRTMERHRAEGVATGVQNAVRVQERYSIGAMVAATEQAYEAILGKSPD